MAWVNGGSSPRPLTAPDSDRGMVDRKPTSSIVCVSMFQTSKSYDCNLLKFCDRDSLKFHLIMILIMYAEMVVVIIVTHFE